MQKNYEFELFTMVGGNQSPTVGGISKNIY